MKRSVTHDPSPPELTSLVQPDSQMREEALSAASRARVQKNSECPSNTSYTLGQRVPHILRRVGNHFETKS